MSAIAGIVAFDGAAVPSGAIERMTGVMAPRGPDGIRHWRHNFVALGHCALRTRAGCPDEPLPNDDASLVLTLDGQLDNAAELRSALQSRGAALRDKSDSELVLRGYEAWGPDVTRHLSGDFALGIWDGRRNMLFCARDQLGVKPFYYHRGSTYFAFASDEEAFLGLPGVSAEPNEELIAAALVYRFRQRDPTRSWLRDVRKLAPGSSMTVDADGAVVASTYWRLEPGSELALASDAEYREAFLALFNDAIRSRAEGASLMLSGGMDSASVAAVAAKASVGEGRKLRTFSVVGDGADPEESRNIRAIVAATGADATCLEMPGMRGPVTDQDLRAAAWSHAHPVRSSILLPAMMYLAAARDGGRAMLDGIDGDLVTWAPIHYVPRLLREGRWRDAWTEAEAASENNTYLRGSAPHALYAKALWQGFTPDWLRRAKLRLWNPERRAVLGSSLVNPEFAKRIGLADRLDELESMALASRRSSLQQDHIAALLPAGIPTGTEGFDRVAGLYGVEARHPWCDRRLVEFCVRLPLRQKVRRGWTKHLPRSSVAGMLPDEVIWHTGKSHLGFSLTRSLLECSSPDDWKEYEAAGLNVAEYVDAGAWRALIHDGISNLDATADRILGIVTLGFWSTRVRSMARHGVTQ